MWQIKDKYKDCCHNDACESFDTCIECWDEWAERNPPMTNADRIRAMSDEELAAQLFLHVDCQDCKIDREKCVPKECTALWLEWLQQPAEVE